MLVKIAIVTGSSRGIGRAIALALAGIGWKVVINYAGNREAAEQTVQQVEALGSAAHLVQADISKGSDIKRLVASTLEHFERIDLLVNNAGIGPRQRIDMLQVGEESFDEVIATNLRGPFFLTQLVANEMIALLKQDKIAGPKIINISSLSAYASSPNRAEYCISKAGVSMMTILWADRLAEYGINVYEIRPGIIYTDITAPVRAKYDQLILEQGIMPIRRWGQPEDVGKAVVAIASDLLPYSTGEIINVDGGFHLHRL